MPVSLTAVSNDGGIARLSLGGEVRHSDAVPGSPNPFRAALGEQWAAARVMVDFAGVQSVDSATVGWLMSSAGQFRRNGGAVVLFAVPPLVHQMFRFMSLERIIKIVPDEPAARAALAAQVPPSGPTV